MVAPHLISERIPLTLGELAVRALVVAAAAVVLVLVVLGGLDRWQGPRLRALACPPAAPDR